MFYKEDKQVPFEYHNRRPMSQPPFHDVELRWELGESWILLERYATFKSSGSGDPLGARGGTTIRNIWLQGKCIVYTWRC